jgi:LCP family protein required for cell wall assembly
MSIGEAPPPRPGRSMGLRAFAALTAIVLMSGAAVSAFGLIQLDEVLGEFGKNNPGLKLPEVTPAEAGKPQTIMILGTDGRLGADAGGGQRSDTIILARLNAKKAAITLMSIPRDLKVDIPGFTLPDKINAAFANGGTALTLKTVKNLLSQPGAPFKINHVVQVNFTGFRKLVDYLNCTFIDVDRHYFNDRGGPGGYAVIDIEPGYQKICGEDALAYVRYRHTDSDLIRGARQQDFIRQLLRGRGVRKKLSFSKRITLARIARRYTRTDEALHSKSAIVSLLKLGLGVADKPVQQVTFGAGRIQDDGDYLVASEDAINDTLEQFMNPKTVTEDTARKPKSSSRKKSSKRRRHKRRRREERSDPSIPSGLVDVSSAGENEAIAAGRKLRFPFYYPKLGASSGRYVDAAPRIYRIPANHRYYQAYRMVVSLGVAGEYYGVQGMSWKSPQNSDDRPGPPILGGPHDTLERNGRELHVYYDGKKVRLVSWQTDHAVYYISNTLTRDLPYDRIVAIAASLTRLGAD